MCWPVIMGDLSPRPTGLYCTRPEAFKTGQPSWAVQGMCPCNLLPEPTSPKHEYRATFRSPCDVIDDITTQNSFSGIIWDDLLIFDVKLKFCLIFSKWLSFWGRKSCFIFSSVTFIKPRSHCADHSLPMFPIIADRPDLPWSWQNHQIVAITPDLCLSKTACMILVRQLYNTGTTEVFDPLLVRFRRPLERPLIWSARLHSRCWRPHPRSCRFATTIKTT